MYAPMCQGAGRRAGAHAAAARHGPAALTLTLILILTLSTNPNPNPNPNHNHNLNPNLNPNPNPSPSPNPNTNPNPNPNLGMDLLRLALERGATAADAARICGELLEAHGQGGACAEGDEDWSYENSFLFAGRVRVSKP